MNETMAERVARAIMESRGGCEVTDWNEAARNPHVAQALAEARAAIEAMREPTREMLSAGAFAGPFTADRWQAMIDSALFQAQSNTTARRAS